MLFRSSGKILTKNRLIGRMCDLALAMKTCGYKKKAWENLFYLLKFEKIDDNFSANKSGTIPIRKNQHLTNNTCYLTSTQNNISALPETLFNHKPLFNSDQSQDLTNTENLPKTFSYLRRASEPLSKFIQESIKYGLL